MRIGTGALLRYGFLALPVAFAGFPLYVLAPDFYATQHGLSLSLLGGLLLALRLFDAVQDPVIGWIVDRRSGNFVPLVCTAAALLCLAIGGLFNTVLFGPAYWFAFCVAVAVSAYSVLTIALGATATLWTEDRFDQTRIAGARETFALLGLVVAVCLPPLLSRFAGADHVYLWYGFILAVLMLAGLRGFLRVARPIQAAVNRRRRDSVSFAVAARALPKESLWLFAVHGLSMLASSIPAVLVLFFVRDRLQAEELTGLFLLLYFLCGAAAMPLWKSASLRFGKYTAWGLSNLLAVTGFIGAFFLDAGDRWFFAAVCAVSGLALGADLTLPPSILADHIHARGNSRFSATHYAFLALIAKASLALASAMALPFLDAAGFKPQETNNNTALLALSIAYALIPCLLKAVAAALLLTASPRSPAPAAGAAP